MPDRPIISEEIEITPEMIEAGADAVRLYDGGYIETADLAARRIYIAMCNAKGAGFGTARAEIDNPI